jgi:hypothetical protein
MRRSFLIEYFEELAMWKLGALWWKFKKEIMMVFAMLRNPTAPADRQTGCPFGRGLHCQPS